MKQEFEVSQTAFAIINMVKERNGIVPEKSYCSQIESVGKGEEDGKMHGKVIQSGKSAY